MQQRKEEGVKTAHGELQRKHVLQDTGRKPKAENENEAVQDTKMARQSKLNMILQQHLEGRPKHD